MTKPQTLLAQAAASRTASRLSAGVSLAYIARMTGCTEGAVKRFEDGSLNTLLEAAKMYRLEKFYAWLAAMPGRE